uniref:Uncharacterized protein n=1 Tax=Anguilla anguilla TaxID=7936 RepID=A0A0E9PX40_ANGAN
MCKVILCDIFSFTPSRFCCNINNNSKIIQN